MIKKSECFFLVRTICKPKAFALASELCLALLWHGNQNQEPITLSTLPEWWIRLTIIIIYYYYYYYCHYYCCHHHPSLCTVNVDPRTIVSKSYMYVLFMSSQGPQTESSFRSTHHVLAVPKKSWFLQSWDMRFNSESFKVVIHVYHILHLHQSSTCLAKSVRNLNQVMKWNSFFSFLALAGNKNVLYELVQNTP